MNKIFKVFFLFVILLGMNGFANAQTAKIAHVNTNEVMNAMPDKAKAENEFEAKRAELLQPLLEKIQNAINSVGKEKGYTNILDVATATTVYIGTDAIDVTKDVKAKLGIK